jgi:hypothetical protein
MTVFIYLVFLAYALAINANPLTVAIYPMVSPDTQEPSLNERIFVELVTSDRKLEACREGSK